MDSLKIFRIVNKLEGFSYIFLLFIAMPLKYGFDMPATVSVAGRIHGLLFVVFCAALLFALLRKESLTFLDSVIYFVLSLIPFGSFYTDHLCAKKTAEQSSAEVES